MIITLLIAFLSLIALMVIHEFGHFIIAKRFGVKVEEFGIGYPPRIAGRQFGETLYSINLIPLGAFVKIHGEEGDVDDYRSFSNLKIWKRILICLGGVIAFWVASIIIFSVVFLIGANVPVGDQDVSSVGSATIQVVQVVKNSPADLAGLKAGDTVKDLRVAGADVKPDKISDFQSFVKNNGGKEINIVVVRDGKNMNVNLIPRISYPSGEGPTGIALERILPLIKKYPWYEAPFRGTAFCWDITVKAIQGIYGLFANLFGGKGLPDGAQLAGPVGITIFLANAASYGVGFFLYFIGSISVFIALFNLFPIPALDGGKLLFLIIEKLAKKPVPRQIENSVTIIFFFLLIAISIFVTIRFDIPRLVDFWKTSL